MKQRRVIYDRDANADLLRIFNWIVQTTSVQAAERILLRIEAAISRFGVASERGQRHDHIEPGLRTASVDERAVIAFKVYDGEVVVLRIFYGGENYLERLHQDRSRKP